MLTFQYTARDPKTGKKVQATVQADSERTAAKLVTQQGLSPIDVVLVGEKGRFKKFRNRIKAKDRILFSRQLATLINAGMPLVQSLRTVSDQTQSSALKIVVAAVISDVESGSSFADALAKHPKVFNQVFTSLVSAGESSGTLDKALERIATQQEKDAEILAKVRGALIYPVIVLTVIVLVIVFLLITVLPQVETLYEDLDKSLPFITNVLLIISKFIINFWPFIIFACIAGGYFLARYFQSESGGRVADRFKMSMPIFGPLFMKLYMARFTRTGTTLSASGVPMLKMLQIIAQAVDNVHIKEATMKAAEKVKSGTALSKALTDDPNFLPLVPQMIKIGETSGSLDQMLDKTATFYENELDNQIKAISTTIEPVLMVVLALVVGLIIAAILIPVYGLVNQNLDLR